MIYICCCALAFYSVVSLYATNNLCNVLCYPIVTQLSSIFLQLAWYAEYVGLYTGKKAGSMYRKNYVLIFKKNLSARN